MAPIFHNFPEGTCSRTPLPCTACNVAICIYTLNSGKLICTPLLNPVMYAHLSLFGKKDD